MPSIASLGIGSGLDLNSLLKNIESAERAALSGITTQQNAYNTKLSAFGQLKSALVNFQAAAAAVGKAGTFDAVTAASSNTGTLGVSAGSKAAPGTYAVNVTRLAQAQSVVSGGQASATTAIGGGLVTIELGTTSGGTFTAGSAAPVEIAVGADSTLNDIRDAINKASAGVTASVVNDGSGTPWRLAITSNSTGESSTMRIGVKDNAGTDSSALAAVVGYDPAGASAMSQTMAGINAQLSINGIDVSSVSNTVLDAVQGVTMTLQAIGTSSVTVKSDNTAITSAVQGFVTAYNRLQGTMASLTAYNPATRSGSPLLGDATTRGIQSQVRAALNQPQASGATTGVSTLMDIGIGFKEDGTLAIDSKKLEDALANRLDGVQQLFSGERGKGGVGNAIDQIVTSLTSSSGNLTNATKGIDASLRKLGDQYTAQSSRIDALMDGYRAQFSRLDLLMNQMNSTSSYLTQQFSAMNASKKS